MIELNIIKNPDKWAISEKTENANDTDIDIVDRIIERHLKAWKLLSKL